MSLMDMTEEKNVDHGFGVVDAPSSTFGDVFYSSMENTARNFTTISKPLFTFLETADRNRAYRDKVGRNLYEDAIAVAPNAAELTEINKMRPGDSAIEKAVDSYLEQAKTDDPDKYGSIRNSSQVLEEVKRKALAAQDKSAKVNAGATGVSSVLGGLAGGVVAGVVDPVNLATIPLGAGLASGVIKTALIDAGINVAVEAATAPAVASWQKQLGKEYGFKDFAENAGVAALFGFSFGGGTKLLSKGLAHFAPEGSAVLSDMRTAVEHKIAEGHGTPRDFDLIDALAHEERRSHIEEANPHNYNEEVAPEQHGKALEEVDAAINGERPLRTDGLGITDEEIRAMDPEKMGTGNQEQFEKMVEPDIEERPASSNKAKEPINEIVDLNEPTTPNLERQKEAEKIYESPQFKSQERTNFEEATKEMKPEERVWMDSEGGDMSIESMKKLFKDDESYMKAISSCGLGGGEE